MNPIGFIRSPFSSLEGMPIQPTGAAGVRGKVELLPEYRAGLKDIEGFSHLILLYLFHRSSGFQLELVPVFDRRDGARAGWIEQRGDAVAAQKSDSRFVSP